MAEISDSAQERDIERASRLATLAINLHHAKVPASSYSLQRLVRALDTVTLRIEARENSRTGRP